MTRLYIVDQSGVEVGGHYYSYTGCVAEGARRLGLDVVVFANKKFRVEPSPADYDIWPCFTYSWAEAELYAPREWRDGNIAYEIFRALRRYPATPDDHVFLHTIGFRELLVLLDWFTTGLLPGDPIPHFHLLLRRDPDILIDNYQEYSRAFAFAAASAYLRGKLHFHADTELLANAFAGITGVPFAVAPIPFPQEHLTQALAARPPRRPGDPLTAVYLGDARGEKGYQHLPAALSYLWPDYVSKGKIRFVLQSNFNTPGGEPGILSAVQNLAGHPATTLLTEALPLKEYYEALAAADLVLIPYSAPRYRYRSSGVLVEAMAAGKPVVTTSGSWMAAEVTAQHAVLFETANELGRAIAEAVDRYPELSDAAQARSRAALGASTSDNLVRHLLASFPEQPAAAVTAVKRHRILLVMNGDGMVLQNGSSRIAQAQLRYLTAAGYDVVGLFLTYRLGQTATELAEWRTALGDAIKPFVFERVFIAGPGERTLPAQELQAIDDERGPPTWPLRADFEFVAGFEFGAPLLRFLRQHPVDTVLLNYITNFPVLDALGIERVPVICEMHDLQSLQRAIYGNRPPDPDDLDEEFRWLARCTALISLNRRETAIVRERLPDAVIETTGVVLPEPPPALRLLAGVTELSEILTMAAPAEREERQDTIAGLGEVGFIDLLFVSSNHLANVSGLRWFLSEVYEPYLAAHQVTLVVAGTIGEIADWPELPRVFFIGPVDDLAPLYAATRVVVLPILDGAGSPVKSYEAFAYGRPLVGTAHAFRGIETDITGAMVADEPSAFADAVLTLLNSELARRQAAEHSRHLARQHNDDAQYYRSMDRVLAPLLGRPTTAAPQRAVVDGMSVEWSPRLQAVNRIVRSFIAGLPLDGWALARLAHEPGPDLDSLIAAVGHHLIEARDATLLDTAPELPTASAQYRGEKAAADLVTAVRFALGGNGERGRVIVSAELPLDVARLGPQSTALDGEKLNFRHLAGRETAGAVLFHAQRGKSDGGRTGLRVIELTSGDNSAMVLRHALPIEPGAQLFGRTAIDNAFALHGDGTAELRPGATGLIRLPRIVNGDGTGFVDLLVVTPEIGGTRAIALAVNGEPTEPQLLTTGALTRARVLLDRNIPGDFGELRIELNNRSPHTALRLAAAYSGLLLGSLEEAAQIATILATIEQRPVASRSPRVMEVAQSAILPIVEGQPLSPAALSLLASVATGDAGMLGPLVDQVLRRHAPANGNGATHAQVKTVVADIEAIVAAYYGTGAADTAIVSPVLPLAVVDRDGHERPYRNMPISWSKALSALPGQLQIKLDAALDIPGHPGAVRFSGFHPPENESAPFRWTGPAASSKVILPLALTAPARLELRLGRTGNNTEATHFAVFCNGDPVAHAFTISGDDALLIAELPALLSAAPWTEIEFTVAHQFQPPLPDLRVLGVVFRSLLVTFLRSQPADSLDLAPPVLAAAAPLREQGFPALP